MSPLADARAHLKKAEEFLDAAELTADVGLLNAATSNAVTSGINSKDAICLKLTGRTARPTTTTTRSQNCGPLEVQLGSAPLRWVA